MDYEPIFLKNLTILYRNSVHYQSYMLATVSRSNRELFYIRMRYHDHLWSIHHYLFWHCSSCNAKNF